MAFSDTKTYGLTDFTNRIDQGMDAIKLFVDGNCDENNSLKEEIDVELAKEILITAIEIQAISDVFEVHGAAFTFGADAGTKSSVYTMFRAAGKYAESVSGAIVLWLMHHGIKLPWENE